MMKLQNKVALITGAGSGIGAATAKLFAEMGAIVILADIDVKKAKLIIEEVKAGNRSAIFFHLDVSNEENWQQCINAINKLYSRLDILINNAGISLVKSIKEMTLAEWHKVMSINLDSVFLGTKNAIPLMEKTGGGRIVNVSSASGLVGSPLSSAYCASKAAIRLFTKSIALECAQSQNNILVNCICPGAVATEIWGKSEWGANFIKEMGSPDKALNAIGQGNPLKRMSTPEEIAKAILFLVTDATYMTGSDLIIDGGYTAQ